MTTPTPDRLLELVKLIICGRVRYGQEEDEIKAALLAYAAALAPAAESPLPGGIPIDEFVADLRKDPEWSRLLDEAKQPPEAGEAIPFFAHPDVPQTPTHQQLFSGIHHFAKEILRLVEVVPVECKPVEPPAAQPTHTAQMRCRKCGEKADIAIYDSGPVPHEPPDVQRDAERWRALIGCARVRLLGSAGLTDPNSNYAHIGVELWNRHPEPSHPDAIERLTQFADKAAQTKEGNQP